MTSEPADTIVDGAALDTAMAAAVPSRPAAYYRSLYKERLDFQQLAADDAEFATFGSIDFRDPAAVMQLTRTLLRRDFGLALVVPPDRLCPPVPNRHAYVQWIGALLADTNLDRDRKTDVVGADVGTGASCIYPLLACAQHAGWRFVATDIDDASLACARANVARNGLQARIRVVARAPHDPLVPVAPNSGSGDASLAPLPQELAFVMTNPPFYASAAEMQASAAAKAQPPHSACTGAAVEMVYAGGAESDGAESESDGGEVAFVGRMIAESARLRERVGWYTAMVGKLSSLAALVARLRSADVGVDNYAVAALVTGSKTRRWALGWSYGPRRPTVHVARGFASGLGGLDSCKHILPPITEVDVWSVPASASLGGGRAYVSAVSAVGAAVDAALRGLELAAWQWDAAGLQGTGRARENVWGRAWRRKKKRASAMDTDTDTSAPAARTECAFGFAVAVRAGVAETTVGCRWLEGHSEATYQSFCGFLKTQLSQAHAEKT